MGLHNNPYCKDQMRGKRAYVHCVHIITQVLFWAENHGNHQNWVPSMVPHKYLTDLNGDERKKKNFEFMNLGFGGFKKCHFFQIHQLSTIPENFCEKIQRIC